MSKRRFASSVIFCILFFSISLISPQIAFANTYEPSHFMIMQGSIGLICVFLLVIFLVILITTLISLVRARKNISKKTIIYRKIFKILVLIGIITIIFILQNLYLDSFLKHFMGADNDFFEFNLVSCFGSLCP